MNFNPRTYVRCDIRKNIKISTYIYFNPRTYVRCDLFGVNGLATCTYFNPRTYVRCDLNTPDIKSIKPSFQSTHLREVRLEFVYNCFDQPQFQSTHLREVRPSCTSKLGYIITISIHAPTWGATCGMVLKMEPLKISIHAPTWGATTCTCICSCTYIISIHAPTWGATSSSTVTAATSVFQSTHLREVRPL